MNTWRNLGIAALQENEHDRTRALSHPIQFYLREMLRVACIFSLLLLIADAVGADVFSGPPWRRLTSVAAFAVVIAALRLWWVRRTKPAADLIRWLQERPEAP